MCWIPIWEQPYGVWVWRELHSFYWNGDSDILVTWYPQVGEVTALRIIILAMDRHFLPPALGFIHMTGGCGELALTFLRPLHLRL